MSPPPEPTTIRAAIAALRTDATAWIEASATAATAGTSAAGLTLDATRLSAAADMTGLLRVYSELQSAVAALLSEAGRCTAATGLALHQAADAYENDERNAVHAMFRAW
ncbi:hypothetical protein [Dactylosporangium sp. CA-233914]|uniref:hypothetical protein n=1 Tax=Dactylosporangium sp. CA-233914 TaxID=3239934 RepID=UPI003D8F6705